MLPERGTGIGLGARGSSATGFVGLGERRIREAKLVRVVILFGEGARGKLALAARGGKDGPLEPRGGKDGKRTVGVFVRLAKEIAGWISMERVLVDSTGVGSLLTLVMFSEGVNCDEDIVVLL